MRCTRRSSRSASRAPAGSVVDDGPGSRGQPLTTNRRFDITDYAAMQRAQPKVYDQHGDYVAIYPSCGLLQQRVDNFRALFLICDGKTRPLMMPDEIKQAFAAFSSDESSRYAIVTSLTAKTRLEGLRRRRQLPRAVTTA